MLVIVGLLLPIIGSKLGLIGNTAIIFGHMNPTLMYYVFLPLLIFECGFHSSWYIYKHLLVNIFILVVPGVICICFFIAFCLKVIYQYDDNELNWYEALLIGSVISTTDTAAVVALLKELGVSVK